MHQLTTQEIRVLRSFLATPVWQSIKTKWMLDFPSKPSVNDAELIRNAVGFDYWHKAVNQLELYANQTPQLRPEKDNDALEGISSD